MRAVAYTEALQTLILIVRLPAADDFRAAGIGWLGRTARDARPRDVQPVEASHPPRHGGHVGAREGNDADRVVLQRQLPLGRHALLRADYRPLVLVHGSVHRAADAHRARSDGGAARQYFRGVPEAASGVHLHRPGHDRDRAREEREGARARAAGRRERPDHQRGRPGGVSADGAAGAACRRPRHGRGGAARGAHELARRCVQRVLDAVHDGLLSQVQAQCEPDPARVGRAGGHDGDGPDRDRVDSGDPGRPRPVRLPAGHAGVSRPADLHGVLLRRVQQAPQRQGLPRPH